MNRPSPFFGFKVFVRVEISPDAIHVSDTVLGYPFMGFRLLMALPNELNELVSSIPPHASTPHPTGDGNVCVSRLSNSMSELSLAREPNHLEVSRLRWLISSRSLGAGLFGKAY